MDFFGDFSAISNTSGLIGIALIYLFLTITGGGNV